MILICLRIDLASMTTSTVSPERWTFQVKGPQSASNPVSRGSPGLISYGVDWSCSSDMTSPRKSRPHPTAAAAASTFKSAASILPSLPTSQSETRVESFTPQAARSFASLMRITA